MLDSSLIGSAPYSATLKLSGLTMPLASTPDSHPSSIVVLGADAVLAALPATPVQLAHACRALGYDVAFPASWGDEVVAGSCLERLGEFGDGPAILCSCPLVTERLSRSGDELAPFMMNLVPPPVAAARYLRALYGKRPVRITYAGACPSASDPSIDARISPSQLLLAFEERGIVLAAQPEFFESVLPPDRRRYQSVPGGAPCAERLDEVDGGRELVELSCADDEIAVEIAQRLVTRQRALIDLAPRMGCVCSGALAVGAAPGARATLTALEPPRSSAPVLDPTIRVDATLPSLAEPAGSERYGAVRSTGERSSVNASVTEADTTDVDTREHFGRTAATAATAATGATAAAAADTAARRRPVVIIRRSAGRGPAIVRGDGAVIPRAYAARPRRASDATRSASHRWSDDQGPLGTTADGARRPRRVTRSVVIPLSSEPPRVLPPPPARQRSGSDGLEIGAVAGDA